MINTMFSLEFNFSLCRADWFMLLALPFPPAPPYPPGILAHPFCLWVPAGIVHGAAKRTGAAYSARRSSAAYAHP